MDGISFGMVRHVGWFVGEDLIWYGNLEYEYNSHQIKEAYIGMVEGSLVEFWFG